MRRPPAPSRIRVLSGKIQSVFHLPLKKRQLGFFNQFDEFRPAMRKLRAQLDRQITPRRPNRTQPPGNSAIVRPRPASRNRQARSCFRATSSASQ